jgi:hypothetical protein
MTAKTSTGIESGLLKRLATVSGIPTIAYENQNHQPTLETPYVQPTLLPLPTEYGISKLNKHVGIFQVSLFYPAGDGTGDAGDVADAIINHFKSGTVLTEGSINIRIRGASRESAFFDESDQPVWYILPVSVDYFAYIID